MKMNMHASNIFDCLARGFDSSDECRKALKIKKEQKEGKKKETS
jgi:hypothetical protein